MLSIVSTAIRAGITRTIALKSVNYAPIKPITIDNQVRCLSTLLSRFHLQSDVKREVQCGSLSQSLTRMALLSVPQPDKTQVRSVTKFSLRRGKRKTVKAVIDRFYRLNWGIWIRPRSGRSSKMWKKSSKRKRRLRQHVFVNATQSTLLDKMVTSFWKRKRFYVDDPYNPYQTRNEFPMSSDQPQPYK